ncbi:hypothetical protein QVD17_26472 [Tagetes erecta]|uniref:Uncharacterized protein n=1 Tax=Tagetes erecta TaxID=13708 RepID=A0AAD8NIL8_TARER|nr:hypothetical protein QVD17_26472 [Tagetes erecta]
MVQLFHLTKRKLVGQLSAFHKFGYTRIPCWLGHSSSIIPCKQAEALHCWLESKDAEHPNWNIIEDTETDVTKH